MLTNEWNRTESISNQFTDSFFLQRSIILTLEEARWRRTEIVTGLLNFIGSTFSDQQCLRPVLGTDPCVTQHSPSPTGRSLSRVSSQRGAEDSTWSVGGEALPSHRKKKILQLTRWVRGEANGKKWEGVEKREGLPGRGKIMCETTHSQRIQRPISWESLKWMTSNVNGKQVFLSLLPPPSPGPWCTARTDRQQRTRRFSFPGFSSHGPRSCKPQVSWNCECCLNSS